MELDKKQAIMMSLNVLLNKHPDFREVMMASKLDDQSKKLIAETSEIVLRLAKRIYIVSTNIEGEWDE